MTLSKRLGSMFLDHLIMTTVITGIAFPLLLIIYFSKRYFNFSLDWLLGILIFTIYLNKDYFRGKGPAKRIIGLQIIDNTTGNPASKTQCFIRNLTCVLWPIEVLVTLFSTQRRIGDMIANTKIISAGKEPIETIINEIKTTWIQRERQ